LSYRRLCHLRADRPAWATVPPRGHFAQVSLTATSDAVTARTVADATGVGSRQRSGAPAARLAAIRSRARCLGLRTLPPPGWAACCLVVTCACHLLPSLRRVALDPAAMPAPYYHG
jgi:hypothetical protein